MREVACALCELRQPVGLTCIGCGVAFGAYSCLKCCFFEDDTSKQQFHCAACGICRVGGVDNFFPLPHLRLLLCHVSAGSSIVLGSLPASPSQPCAPWPDTPHLKDFSEGRAL